MIFNTHRGLRDINPIYVVSIRSAKFIPFITVSMNSSHLNYRVDVIDPSSPYGHHIDCISEADAMKFSELTGIGISQQGTWENVKTVRRQENSLYVSFQVMRILHEWERSFDEATKNSPV